MWQRHLVVVLAMSTSGWRSDITAASRAWWCWPAGCRPCPRVACTPSSDAAARSGLGGERERAAPARDRGRRSGVFAVSPVDWRPRHSDDRRDQPERDCIGEQEANAPFLVPLVAPRRQQAGVQSKCVGLRNDPVDVREVRFVRLGRVVVPDTGRRTLRRWQAGDHETAIGKCQ